MSSPSVSYVPCSTLAYTVPMTLPPLLCRSFPLSRFIVVFFVAYVFISVHAHRLFRLCRFFPRVYPPHFLVKENRLEDIAFHPGLINDASFLGPVALTSSAPPAPPHSLFFPNRLCFSVESCSPFFYFRISSSFYPQLNEHRPA